MINAVSNPAAPAQTAERDKLKAVATQFEAVFLRQMISSMRSASLGDDILGSDATNQFRDMADGRTADAMAEKGALGIAELLLRQFSHQYPGAGRGPAPAGVLDPGLRRGTGAHE